MFARAMQSHTHPVLAQIIPTRRCNLACAYCSEFDSVSRPVPTDEMLRRVDRLAALGTGIVTLSGGEPLLHPDAELIVRRIRRHGIIATVITNGYPLTRTRITRLNRAGLDSLQISIDNVSPDEVSRKSLALVDAKLRLLRDYAEYDVTVNAVVGSGVRNPEDAVAIVRRAKELGFRSTVGIVHDDEGRLRPLDDRNRAVLRAVAEIDRPVFSFDRYNRFQDRLARGLPNVWSCHAGSRYLYVCEDGLVHYCSQQRGHPGIPLADYTPADLERECSTVKPCAPYCTVGCVHRVAMLDELREQPLATLTDWFSAGDGGPTLPLPVRLLMRLLVTGKERTLAQTVARLLLRL
jgi:MoaA/NifB/PqqE/SkfB family radical SAM enzyme